MRSIVLSFAAGIVTLASCSPPPGHPGGSAHGLPWPDLGRVYPDRCSEPWPLGVRDQVWPPGAGDPCTVGGHVGWPVEPPELESRVDPAAPAGCKGVVVVEVLIDREGRPRSPRVLQGLGEPCDGALLAVLPRWRFRPARWNGPPVVLPECAMRRCDAALVYLAFTHTFVPGARASKPGP